MNKPHPIPSGLILLKKIVEGTSTDTGENFFKSLVKSLAEVLNVHGVWVTEYLRESHRLRAIAFYLGDDFVDEYEYEVEGTPCEPVLQRESVCHFPSRVIELFPRDPDLPKLGAVSYMGLALTDEDGTTLGHLAVLDNKPMDEIPEYYAMLEIFAARATAEIRRLKADQMLKESQQKLHRLINGTMEYIIELDENLKLVQFNRSAAEALALDRGLESGQVPSDMFTGDAWQQIQEITDHLKTSNLETLYRIPEDIIVQSFAGRKISVHVSISCYTHQQSVFFALIMQNRDEQVQSREEIRKLNLEKALLQEKIKSHQEAYIVGNSLPIKNALEMVRHVAPSNTNVLILGETGTGKELFAQALHRGSARRDKVMVTVNCAALPRELIESELFGHVKGAFTGAFSDRTGRFSMADQGTIFLDEIGEMPLELQAKLLRVLQQGEFEPLGSSKTVKVNVRVIAATNRDLKEEVARGRFREDLYYRLNVFPISIPPLRERGADIIHLAETFIARYSDEMRKKADPLTEKDKQLLMAYHWPGNVRELQNVMERSIILSKGGKLDFGAMLSVSANEVVQGADDERILQEEEIKQLVVDNIVRALNKTGWRIYGEEGAARLLNVPHTTLSSRIRKYGIVRKLT